MEEVSLKEIIKVLLKGKFIIAAVTIIALAVGAVSYWVLPERYSATVSLLANPIVGNVINTTEGATLDAFSLPEMNMSSYLEQFSNNYTLRKTIEELNLRDNEGNYITPESLRSMVSISNPTGTNILDVDVSGRNPERNAQIANAMGRHFIDYITDVYQTSAGISARALAERLQTEGVNLDKEAIRLRDYLITSDNVELIKAEINGLIRQITDYKTQMNDLEIAIAADRISVGQMREQGWDEPHQAEVRLQTPFEEANWPNPYALSIGGDGLAQTLYTLRLADLETRLVQNINKKEELTRQESGLQERLSDLQARRAEEEYKYNALLRDLGMAESVYNSYSTQYRQALLAEAANLGKVNIKIISEALIPTVPNNKNLILTMGLAGGLGVFFGCFIVLFREYWATTA